MVETANVQLFVGDCLEVLPTLGGPVDAIITDLPYGTTGFAWDAVIPLAPMWEEAERLLSPCGVFVTTSSQLFTTTLISSRPEWFKYELIWEKSLASGFLHSKNRPMKAHENIVVFSPGTMGHVGQVENRMTYNPQMEEGEPYSKYEKVATKFKWGGIGRPSMGDYISDNPGTRFPRSVLHFANPNHDNHHGTQKPVDLYEYLIRTFTNEGDTVLDFTMGSGTTGVACVNTGRKFIGIEIDPAYVEIARRRIEAAQEQARQLSLFGGRQRRDDGGSAVGGA